jgi:hypothetical protein
VDGGFGGAVDDVAEWAGFGHGVCLVRWLVMCFLSWRRWLGVSPAQVPCGSLVVRAVSRQARCTGQVLQILVGLRSWLLVVCPVVR